MVFSSKRKRHRLPLGSLCLFEIDKLKLGSFAEKSQMVLNQVDIKKQKTKQKRYKKHNQNGAEHTEKTVS